MSPATPGVALLVADVLAERFRSGSVALTMLVPCPTGFARLRFRPRLAGPATAQVTLELLGGSGVVLDVGAATLAAVPSCRPSGTVRTATGQSLAGVRVTYQATGAAANTCVDTDTRSDAQGAYDHFHRGRTRRALAPAACPSAELPQPLQCPDADPIRHRGRQYGCRETPAAS